MGFSTGLAVGTAMGRASESHGGVDPNVLLAIYLVANGILVISFIVLTLRWVLTRTGGREDLNWIEGVLWNDGPNVPTVFFAIINSIALFFYLVTKVIELIK